MARNVPEKAVDWRQFTGAICRRIGDRFRCGPPIGAIQAYPAFGCGSAPAAAASAGGDRSGPWPAQALPAFTVADRAEDEVRLVGGATRPFAGR